MGLKSVSSKHERVLKLRVDALLQSLFLISLLTSGVSALLGSAVLISPLAGF